jgi:hypothetical protein
LPGLEPQGGSQPSLMRLIVDDNADMPLSHASHRKGAQAQIAATTANTRKMLRLPAKLPCWESWDRLGLISELLSNGLHTWTRQKFGWIVEAVSENPVSRLYHLRVAIQDRTASCAEKRFLRRR